MYAMARECENRASTWEEGKLLPSMTLHNVARRAGVSHVAVSRVLNVRYKGEVSEERAVHIRHLSQEMGYALNRAVDTNPCGIVAAATGLRGARI